MSVPADVPTTPVGGHVTDGLRAVQEDVVYAKWVAAKRALVRLYDELELHDGAGEAAVQVDEAIGCVLRALPLYVGGRRARSTPALERARRDAARAAARRRSADNAGNGGTRGA